MTQISEKQLTVKKLRDSLDTFPDDLPIYFRRIAPICGNIEEAGCANLDTVSSFGVADACAIIEPLGVAMKQPPAKVPAGPAGDLVTPSDTDQAREYLVKLFADFLGCHDFRGYIRDELAAVRQRLPVQAPAFSVVAAGKLAELQAKGFAVNGVSIEKTEGGQVTRGFITHGGMVGWWAPDAGARADKVPLTDEQIEQATGSDRSKPLWLAVSGIARAVEAAHGIKAAGQEGGAS